ncbi:hypothetical protein ES703_102374 [subsurface metagenome]
MLRIGISNYGELLSINGESAGLEYPSGYEHIATGDWVEGYLAAYMDGGGDNVAYAMFDDRSSSPGWVPVSYNIIKDSATMLGVCVVTETDDGMLRLEQQFCMPKNENAVQITMTLTNIGAETTTDVVFKRCVDLDTDSGGANGWADYDNIFDIDSSRNMVYAYTTATYPPTPRTSGQESHYVGIAGCPTPDYYDVDDWDDYDQRDSPVNFTTYPQYNDYTATLQWNFGAMNPGGSETVQVVYSVGNTLDELHGCPLAPCPLAPLADFSAVPTTGLAPLTVQFTDLSACSITSWLWQFGDGESSTAQNPIHIYRYPGTYTVSLTISGPGGTDREVKVDYIEVFTVMAPARLIVRNLQIVPAQAFPEQLVTISADVVNQGGSRGSKRVDLVINGQAEQAIRVGVDPGGAQHIIFTTTKSAPGTYEVFIEGQTSAFTVLLRPQAPPPAGAGAAGGLDTTGIIAIVVIGVLLIAGVIVVFVLTRRAV